MATRLDTWDASLGEINGFVQDICRAAPKTEVAGSCVEVFNAMASLRSSILALRPPHHRDLPAALPVPLATRVAQLICSSGMCRKLSALYSEQTPTLSHVVTVPGSEGALTSRSAPLGAFLSSNVMHSIATVLEGCSSAFPGMPFSGDNPAAVCAAAEAALFELLRDTLVSGLWVKAAGQLHQADDEDGA